MKTRNSGRVGGWGVGQFWPAFKPGFHLTKKAPLSLMDINKAIIPGKEFLPAPLCRMDAHEMYDTFYFSGRCPSAPDLGVQLTSSQRAEGCGKSTSHSAS